MRDPATSAWTGRRLGVYQLQERIGTGGMGEVYRARDTRLGRDVAVKILPRALITDPDRRSRLEGEARILAALNHPNIATIHGIEESDGVRALVMELVEGPTLADRIAQGPIRLTEACALAAQIAKGLEAAHERGIIHRDLKPANIKVRSDGTVKVLDFGLAKLSETAWRSDAVRAVADSDAPTTAGPARTQAGAILGTPAYMSPEHASGQAIDKRTDIWAFGCVVYEMLTGVPAFRGETTSDTLGRIFAGPPDWGALPDNTPEQIRNVLLRCLVRDSNQRLRDIGEARITLEDSVFGLREEARKKNPGAVSSKPKVTWASSSRLALIALMVLLASLFTIGVVLVSRSPQSTIEPPASEGIVSADASARSRDELIGILEGRAQRILSEMDQARDQMTGEQAESLGQGDRPSAPDLEQRTVLELHRADLRDLERIRALFEQLHRKHIEALRGQLWVLAHEIEVEIYHLLYLYEPFRQLVVPTVPNPSGAATESIRNRLGLDRLEVRDRRLVVPLLATAFRVEGMFLRTQMESYPASEIRPPVRVNGCVFDRVKAMVRNPIASPSTPTEELPCKPDDASTGGTLAPTPPPLSEYKTWLQLSKGMPAETVKRILGEPDHTTTFGPEEVWYYAAGKYRVFLTDGKFDRWTD
jgi:serine/threonine protein kinase